MWPPLSYNEAMTTAQDIQTPPISTFDDLRISRFNFVVAFFIVLSVVWTVGTVYGLTALGNTVNEGRGAAAASSLPFYIGMGLLFAGFGMGIFVVCLWMLCGRQRVSLTANEIFIENSLLGHIWNRRTVKAEDINRVEAQLNTSDQWWVKIFMKEPGYIIALGGGLPEKQAHQLEAGIQGLLP